MLIAQERFFLQSTQLVVQTNADGHAPPRRTPESLALQESKEDESIAEDYAAIVKRPASRRHKREQDLFRFRTPTWLTSRVCETRISRACSGWTVHLSSYHVRPEDASVFSFAEQGDVGNLRRLFESGEASPFDRNPGGETLLHVSKSFADT